MTPVAVENKQSDLHGIGLVMFGIVLFSLQDVIIKQISSIYPVQELVFVRSVIALLLLLGLMYLRGNLGRLRTQHLVAHLVRGTILCGSYITYFLAIAAIPLADAVAIYFVSPLVVSLLSITILKEAVNRRQVLALIVGFGGTLVIMRPGIGVFEPAALFPLAAAALYATSVIMTRRMAATESGMAMAVYVTVVYLVINGLFGAFRPNGIPTTNTHPSIQFLARSWQMPTAQDFFLLFLTGIIAAVGFFCLSQAYLVARATVVAPFEYVMLPLSVLWGFLFWREVPDAFTIVGASMIIGAGLLLLARRPKRKRWLFLRR